MEKIFSAIPFYYGATEKAPNTERVMVEMNDRVDGALFTEAVKQAMRRYPYFCVRVCSDGREFTLEDNDAEVVVKETACPVSLGGTEANGHLLAFSWWEDSIYLDMFHGLSDGGGLFPLLRTVLYYYCREKYDGALSPDGIRLAGEDIPREEIDEPYPRSVDEGIRPVGKAQRKAALNLSAAGLCHPGKPTMYCIRIPEDAYMKYSKDKDGSPAVMTVLFMAKAIDSIHRDSGLPIICGMAMNTRKALGRPLSHHSLVSQLFLEYKQHMRHMDTRDQATCFRGMVMVQGQDENVMDSVRNNIRLFERMDALPDIADRQKMMQQVVSSFLDVDTFKVSYVGKSGMGASEKYIKSIYSSVDLNGSGIMIEVNSVNGEFCLSFLQEWEESVYVDAFLKQLEQEGIPYTLARREALRVASVEIGG